MAKGLAIEWSPSGPAPLFVQIAQHISAEIERGRLGPKARLPGSRALAEQLGVHRNTVLAAYAELESQGWVDSEPARGTFVAESFVERLPAGRRRATSRLVEFDLPAAPWPSPFVAPESGVLELVGGVPDPRLMPDALLARAYRRVLRQERGVLAYGSERGHLGLRRALATRLREERGLGLSEDELIITRGSQMALFLAARALLRPGDVVAVEAVGYRPAWEALRMAGAELVPIPVDGDGLDVDRVAKLLDRQRIRALYVTPHHQYPTMVTLSAPRRMALLALARQHRIAVFEDDYDHEFHYEGKPVLPLASMDTAGVVIYIGTLSKVLAPGIRMGYACAQPAIIDSMARSRTYVDRQGDLAVEGALAELMADGEVGRHARRVRRIYTERRNALVTALTRELGGVLRFSVPTGGMSIFARVDAGIDTDAWAARGLECGVLFHPGRRFRFDARGMSAVRLGFAPLTPEEIATAVGRMREALAGAA